MTVIAVYEYAPEENKSRKRELHNFQIYRDLKDVKAKWKGKNMTVHNSWRPDCVLTNHILYKFYMRILWKWLYCLSEAITIHWNWPSWKWFKQCKANDIWDLWMSLYVYCIAHTNGQTRDCLNISELYDTGTHIMTVYMKRYFQFNLP